MKLEMKKKLKSTLNGQGTLNKMFKSRTKDDHKIKSNSLYHYILCSIFDGEMVGKVDTGLGRGLGCGHRFSITTVQTLAVIAHLSLFSCIVSSLK
jgi:hypothetical protein